MRAARSVQKFRRRYAYWAQRGRELPCALGAFALIEINDRIIVEPALNELHQIYERAARKTIFWCR
jgi:hypothetical protein